MLSLLCDNTTGVGEQNIQRNPAQSNARTTQVEERRDAEVILITAQEEQNELVGDW